MRPHIPRAKIRAQSPVLAVVLLAILVMVSAVLGWLGGLVAWLIVLGALIVFAFCLRARPLSRVAGSASSSARRTGERQASDCRQCQAEQGLPS
jgi:hypothetical protein